jgi:hypothetical protein
MLRYALSAFGLVLCLGLVAVAADDKPPKDAMKATVVRVDETGNKITLKWTDKDGKPQERAFEVKDTVKLYGAGGKPARLNEFKAGSTIHFTELAGTLTGVWMEPAGGGK